jgi:hypothetical protein
MKLLLLFGFIFLAYPLFSQQEKKVHTEEKSRPIKTYQGVKQVKQLFFISTEELKSCFKDEKIPMGFPGYNSSLNDDYNKNVVKEWYALSANREKLNDQGIRKFESYLND